jgi:hypothetical protein
MPKNYVVLRRSPDWLTFDLEETRAFCRAGELPEDTILRFVARWDAVMAVGFLEYRHRMKQLALRSAHAVKDATVVPLAQLAEQTFAPDDLIYFTDDDDWVCSDLFAALRARPAPVDGFLWRSIFIGKLFSDTAYEGVDSPAVSERPASTVVYTNNYAVTGAAWSRLGPGSLLEHFHAQGAVDRSDVSFEQVDLFLSAANKHPCCTVSIAYNDRSDWFVANTRAAIQAYIAALVGAPLGPGSAWIRPCLDELIAINRDASADRGPGKA